jgi:hypothetical protein
VGQGEGNNQTERKQKMTTEEALEQDRQADIFATRVLGRSADERATLLTDREKKMFIAGWEAAKEYTKKEAE